VMPGTSGVTLAKEVRRLYPGLRIIYASGFPEDRLSEHGALDEDTVLLTKPLTAEALRRALRTSLEPA
jgi:two-component system cell cycle sensor histidine kinase/response regulator CckA